MSKESAEDQEVREREFRRQIGLNNRWTQFLVNLYALFDGGWTRICLDTLWGEVSEVERLLWEKPELVTAVWSWGPGPEMPLLHCALSSFQKRQWLVELLLDHEADVQAEDSEGKTPLDYAIQLPRNRSTRRMVQLLKEHGAF